MTGSSCGMLLPREQLQTDPRIEKKQLFLASARPDKVKTKLRRGGR